MRIVEGLDGFAQGFSGLANELADFLQFLTQLSDGFQGLITVSDSSIRVKTLVSADDARCAFVNRMRLSERLLKGIQATCRTVTSLPFSFSLSIMP